MSLAPLATTQSNQDLLAEIFGSSNTQSTGTTTTPSQQQKSTVDDILGLFGSSSQTPVPTSTTTGSSALTPTSLPPTPASEFPSTLGVSTPVQPPQQKLTAYPAYEKNGLKITLTPQPLAARPGVVMILARFQVSGSNTATNLNFQAAVPKVFLRLLPLFVEIDSWVIQSQQLQMLPMSNPSVSPGSVETQQMRVVAPVGVR